MDSPVTTRWLRPDDHALIEQACELTARVFAAQGDGYEYEPILALMRAAYRGCVPLRVERCAVVLRAGRVIAKCQLLDLTVRVGRARIAFAGAHAAVSEPGADDAGILERVIAFARDELSSEKALLLGVVPRGALYQLLGGATIGVESEWQVDVANLPPLAQADDAYRAFEESLDLDAILEFHALDGAERSASLVRTAELWPWLMRRPPEIWLERAGYLGVRELPGSLELVEACGRDSGFYPRALRKAAQLARSRGLRRLSGSIAPDHPLVRASAPYGAKTVVDHPARGGLMGYILDLPRFFRALQPELERRLLESPWRGAALELALGTPDGDACGLRMGEGAAQPRRVSLELSRSALLQLAFGFIDVRSLLAAQPSAAPTRARHTEDELSLLAAIFPVGHPFLWHGDRW